MCLEKNKKRLERNETCLARDETRGGNLLLSSSVCSPCKENQKANQKTAASKSMHVVTLFQAYKESAKSEHFFNISFKSSFQQNKRSLLYKDCNNASFEFAIKYNTVGVIEPL